jgi:outer membrane protein OmpA-like peptidoglycan-associated protein
MKFYEFPTSEATQLTGELKSYLDAVAKYLQENPSAEIRVVGHSDNIGTAEENQRRSVIRKDRVVRYLLAKGINRYRILDRGEGDRKPIADTRTAEGRKKNRRVEITIIQ